MIRGTTATFNFTLPYDYSTLSVAKIVFWQPGNNGTTARPMPIVKYLGSCTGSGTTLTVTLNQAETLCFTEDLKAKMQLRAKTSAGIVFASKEEDILVYPICEDVILDGSGTSTIVPDVVYLDGGRIDE